MSVEEQTAPTIEVHKTPFFIWWTLATLIAMVVGAALFFGIKQRSMNEAQFIGGFLLFVATPSYCWILRDHPKPIWKLVSKWILRLWWVYLFYQVAIISESLWWKNGDTYPKWLVTEATVTPEQTRYMFAPRSLCGSNPLGAFVTKSNEVFVRCGDTWRPGNTYWIENYREASHQANQSAIPLLPPAQEITQ